MVTVCLPAKRTGLPGRRARAVLVTIPDIAAAVTGIFNRIILDAEEVGTERVVAGFWGALALGLESKADVAALADGGDKITFSDDKILSINIPERIVENPIFWNTCLIDEVPLTSVGVPITFCPWRAPCC